MTLQIWLCKDTEKVVLHFGGLVAVKYVKYSWFSSRTISEVSLCVLEFVVFFSGQAFHLKILQIG